MSVATMAKPDKATKRWTRNVSDELAVANGCWFEEERAEYVVNWIETYCRLYEGDKAGKLMALDDWQRDVFMRLFGWVRHSDEYGRTVRRFTKCGVWVPKKNGKSPTLAALGLYLLCGDGEQGQKVFSAAKDGKQARIAHQHALEMVRQSPELSDECEINQSTGRITHMPTRSFYDILAGDNFKGQEGINGCVLIDETHVVDRRLAKTVRFAGASRSEPIHAEFSTSGNDPDGYGKEQYDWGKRVEAGEIVAQHFFYQAYEAPQDTQPEHLEDRDTLIRLGKQANPAWGRIIRESEFLQAYDESKDSRSKMFDFLMYRMNVWQHSVNPWLSSEAWKACRADYSAESLLGRACWAGLDLASVRDLNALSLCFPDDGKYKFLWWFWLPEETARLTSHLVPWFDWEHDPKCNLTLTPGSSMQYELIRKQFRELAQKYNIRQLAFDKYGAEETTRYLSEGQSLDGKTIEEATGVERIEFPQSIAAFNEPTKKFESLILSGKLQHNGDPCMNWQAGHATTRADVNGNVKPLKPRGKDDIKKIDGLIAGVMALAVASRAQEEESVYQTQGLFVL